ncbi:MAG TPA: aldehyde dehydrogenase family protein [Stellaceae bacterium]|nr:aldehyde dehydrogenase family protein [Stellaceae bacterium]
MGKMLQVVQAFDRHAITEIPADDAATLEAKLSAAARAFRDRDSWLKPHQRAAVLQKAADLLATRQERFTTLIAREGGKPWKDAAVEVMRAIDGIRNAADELRNFAGKQIPMGLTPASDGRWAFTTKEPIGIVASISAFNHPLNLIVHQVAPAIAVGCPVIVKPAAPTPLCCVEFVALLHEAGLAEPWCQTLITDDNALAEALVTDSRVAFLSFIGSAKVGWYLRSKLPPGTRCALEHGGAAPVIVDRSADLDKVVPSVVKGGYYHSGQVCVSVQRIFVHREIQAEFTDRLAAAVAKLRVGDPISPDTDAGPLILPRETVRVQSWIDEATAAGTRIIGGGRLSETTLLPSILVEPPADAKVSTLEIFGPTTCVYGFDGLDDAIARANTLPYAFQSSVFTTELEPALRAAQRFDAATVLINDHTAFRVDWMPFAGLHQSGYRTGGIPYTMQDMVYDKMVVLNLGT